MAMKRILILSASLLLLCNVGISQKMKIRSEKPEDHVVSMMSFNIRHGNGMDRQVDLGRIAAEIALVGLPSRKLTRAQTEWAELILLQR